MQTIHILVLRLQSRSKAVSMASWYLVHIILFLQTFAGIEIGCIFNRCYVVLSETVPVIRFHMGSGHSFGW